MNPNAEAEQKHASTPMSNTSPLSHLSRKHVFLCDWWLASADGAGLAVSGLESRRGKLPRIFNSAKVSKIDDAFTLETVDGITVQLSGIINRSRTLQNGFPHEVCSHFLNGFPYYWESYNTQPFENLPESSASLRNSSVGLNKMSPFPALLNLHVTRMHDFVIFQHMDSENLLSDLLEGLGTNEGLKDDDEIIDQSGVGKKEKNERKKDELTSGEEKVENSDLCNIHPSTCTIRTRSMTRSTSALKNLTEEISVRTRSMTRSQKARKS